MKRNRSNVTGNLQVCTKLLLPISLLLLSFCIRETLDKSQQEPRGKINASGRKQQTTGTEQAIRLHLQSPASGKQTQVTPEHDQNQSDGNSFLAYVPPRKTQCKLGFRVIAPSGGAENTTGFSWWIESDDGTTVASDDDNTQSRLKPANKSRAFVHLHPGRYTLFVTPESGDKSTNESVFQKTIEVINLETFVNGTTDDEPDSDDDFVIASDEHAKNASSTLHIHVSAPDGFQRTVQLRSGGSGTIRFGKTTVTVHASTSKVIELYGIRESNKKDSATIRARIEGTTVSSEDLTVIKNPALLFQGDFQDRLSTAPDPGRPNSELEGSPLSQTENRAARRGRRGVTRALPGEPDFDRIIRFSEPKFMRTFCSFEPVTIKRVVAGKPDGVKFKDGDAVLGEQVNIGKRSVFDADPDRDGQNERPIGKEIINQFRFRIGTNTFSGHSSSPPEGKGFEFSDQLEQVGFWKKMERVDYVNQVMKPSVLMQRKQRMKERIAKLIENLEIRSPSFNKLQERLRIIRHMEKHWDEVTTWMKGGINFPVKIDQKIGIHPGESKVMRFFEKRHSEGMDFHVNLIFFGYDHDCLIGQVIGSIHPCAGKDKEREMFWK